MNYHNITKCDMNNGQGLRSVLWVSGCNHNCLGCHNPQTHDVCSGIPFDESAEQELFESLNYSYIDGITFCGGSPLHENNRSEVLRLIKKFRELFPTKSVWLYTGYTYEEIQNIPDAKEVVENCDVLIDGRFVLSLKDNNLHWRGSSNQRVIDIKKTLACGKIILVED